MRTEGEGVNFLHAGHRVMGLPSLKVAQILLHLMYGRPLDLGSEFTKEVIAKLVGHGLLREQDAEDKRQLEVAELGRWLPGHGAFQVINRTAGLAE